jgi:hypothetical protein
LALKGSGQIGVSFSFFLFYLVGLKSRSFAAPSRKAGALLIISEHEKNNCVPKTIRRF